MKHHKYADTITAEVIGQNSKSLFTCIYRSGTPEKAKQNDGELYKLIKSITDIPGYQSKTIAGDFNLNRISWTPEPELPTNITEEAAEYKFVEKIRDSFLCQHVTEPTRYREGNRPTCDDLIFSSYENGVSNISYEAPLGSSDHITLTCNIHTNLKPTQKSRVYYNFNRGNYPKMKTMMSKDWEEILAGKSVQQATDKFEEIYNNAVNDCIPKHNSLNNNRKKPIWMDYRSYRQVKKKYSSWLRYLNTKQAETYLNYVRERNKSTNENKKARKNYEKKLAKECRKNPKSVWQYMKSTNRVASQIPNLKKPDGTSTTTDEEIAETLNQQYTSSFTDEDTSNIPNIPPKPLSTPKLNSFTVTEEQVLKELKDLKPNKSPGIDGLHPRVLREIADEIAKPLTIIFQKSLNATELPQHWLQAIITPIFKKGSKSSPENYRPVSLTCILCKILEKLVVKTIIQHIKENELATLRQHGFTPGKSVTTNLLEVMNIWSEALMHDIPVDVIYLDYRKAFDCVPHKRLIKQINSFGIEGNAIKWLEAFLTGRKQKVRVNGAESAWAPVISGIPQGSILGPIMFSLFVNDMPDEVTSLISLFADDTKVYLPLTSNNSARQLQEDLWKLEHWAKIMLMKFHPLKCKVLHLGRNNQKAEYFMHNDDGSLHKLENPDVEKDLGVFTDYKLHFTDHCQQKVNAANRTLRYIKHTFKHIDEDMFMLLYRSMVRPILEFSSCVWSPFLKYNIDSLERVQRRATKMIPTLQNLTYQQRLEKLNLETLSYRRKRADLLETYRIRNNLHKLDQSCHCSICPDKKMFMESLSTTTRGHSKKVQIQEATGIRKHFFSSRVAAPWNNLSEKTIQSPTINAFKNNLKSELPDKFSFTFSY